MSVFFNDPKAVVNNSNHNKHFVKKTSELSQQTKTSVCRLNELNPEDVCVITYYDKNINFNIKRRLLELGLVVNKQITLQKKSFLNDVLLLEVNGYLLSLRSNIAKHICVKQL